MNIALPAFLLIILIAPGYLFLSAFERKEQTNLSSKPFDVFSAQALIIAALLHLTAMSLLSIVGELPDFDGFLKVLTGNKLDSTDLQVLSVNIKGQATYHASIAGLGFVLGKAAQAIRFKTNPYKESRFAYSLPWYYELRGQLSNLQNADIIKVSCTVQSAGETYIYSGFLGDFYLCPKGDLDRIVLLQAVRRLLSADPAERADAGVGSNSARFYEIKGDRLIIKYSDITTINMQYLTFQIAEDA
ncbi:hypothetical protein [Polycladidibacter hongkongensis]|uniref:hypothetical protein n=1 Tax=Polycladidibacter hongkongensis TaxID=1647556 RepID=UPI000833D6BF|nr:hypothetical protein [Pseudovibrio hongkongensis]